jgi:hypothetical protein
MIFLQEFVFELNQNNIGFKQKRGMIFVEFDNVDGAESGIR